MFWIDKLKICLCDEQKTSVCLIDTHDKENNTGRNALHFNARYGNTDCISIILAAGGVVDAKDNDGATALELAAWQGHCEIVNILLHANALVDNFRNPDNVAGVKSCNSGMCVLPKI